jgi:hypothetical protein
MRNMSVIKKQKKMIICRCVYKIKYHNDDIIERYKARLVAKEYIQIYNIETYALIVKMNTV